MATQSDSDRRLTRTLLGVDSSDSETSTPVIGIAIVDSGRVIRWRHLDSGGAPRRFLLVGASSHCDIRVEADPYVSAVHCLLHRDPRSKRVYIHDGESKNGVFVNGMKIQMCELAPRASIRIGRTHLVAIGQDGRLPGGLS